MRTLKQLRLVFGSVLIMACTTQILQAQTYQLNGDISTLKIEGTSNLHDWQITAEKQQGKLLAEVVDGKITKIQQLDFTVTAESLKSGKSAMDKNTYKALKTDKHKKIIFELTKVKNIDCATSKNCKVDASGNLTIAGVTKPIDITFESKVFGTKIILVGSKKLKMTDFGVSPPTALLGTITTGDAIDIKFEANFLK